MRFITEFELDGSKWDQTIKGYRQLRAEEKLGHLISAAFGFSERGETTLVPDSPVIHKRKLEIEAFPMEDYLAFKRNLLDYLIDKGINPKVIQDKFSILESLGKPSGDTITNS